MAKAYADLADLPEDDRITIIGQTVLKGRTVAVCIDADPPEKADRYVAKLLARFPGVRVLGRDAGPVKGVVTVRFGPGRTG